jgi:hypothetical protein
MTKLSAYISSKFFRGSLSPDAINEKLVEMKINKQANYLPLGKLIGHAVGFEETIVPDDMPKLANKKENSILLIGKFEAICYETGEVKEAAGAYLPTYFRKMVQGQIDAGKANGEGALFAIEMGAELTGRTIPWAWVVTNLIPDDVESPMGRLKAKLDGLGTPLLTGHNGEPLLIGTDKKKAKAA